MTSTDPDTFAVTRREAFGAIGAGAAIVAVAAPVRAASAPIAPAAMGPLYPHESSTRSTRDLSGLWRFRLDKDDVGERERWFDGLGERVRHIPVPCSWNDLFDDAQNHFGPAWYETDLWVEEHAADRLVRLRFGSAVYHATAWLDGVAVGEHDGGHLPFAFDITALATPGRAHRLVVRVENELRVERVPGIPDPATARFYQNDYPQTTYDFFPYAGLDRPVLLCGLPATHVEDLTVVTDFAGRDGVVTVDVIVSGGWSGPARLILEGGRSPVAVTLAVRDGRGRATLRVPGVRAWSPDDPFLYRLTTEIGGAQPIDRYHLKIGVRTVAVRGGQILLNGKPVLLTGFGKHEDFPIHGRGLDLPVLVRDFELLKGLGANSFRTSHYPYAEEALMLADAYGFLVIAETPGVSLVFMDPPAVIEARYAALEAALTAAVGRDRNHPCIILWSLANEPLLKPFHTTNANPPDSATQAGTRFFERLFARARALDPSRPVTIVQAGPTPNAWSAFGDVICINSYNGWYSLPGQLDRVAAKLDRDIAALHAAHPDKPIIASEFGAEAIAGEHAEPAAMWSEEYQADMIEIYSRTLGKYPFVAGTHPWTFADFKTPQNTARAGGLNRKGVFTRDRQPKLAAHRLRDLWKGKG